MIIACVLKSGGDFKPRHVARLYDQFLDHAPVGVRFECLTDIVDEVRALGVPATALEHGWPGWWSKLEALRLSGPCLYLDLDVTITGDLTPLIDVSRETPFAMCRDFWGMEPHGVNSSVMVWARHMGPVYRAFRESPNAHMSIYGTREKWGDQAFVRDYLGIHNIPMLQDLVPGKIASFKREVQPAGGVGDARVVVSHGKPRPWAPDGADAWLARRRAKV